MYLEQGNKYSLLRGICAVPPRFPFRNKEPISLIAGHVSGRQRSAVSPLGNASDKESDFASGHIFPWETNSPVAQPSSPNSGGSEGSSHFQNSPHFRWHCITARCPRVPSLPPSLHPMRVDLNSTLINLLHAKLHVRVCFLGIPTQDQEFTGNYYIYQRKRMFGYGNPSTCAGLR